jgi:hypothetical protein
VNDHLVESLLGADGFHPLGFENLVAFEEITLIEKPHAFFVALRVRRGLRFAINHEDRLTKIVYK